MIKVLSLILLATLIGLDFSGSSFVVSTGSFLDVSNWLNPAKLTLYYQTNSSTQWIQDFCGQRTTEPCEQICEQDTGEFAVVSVALNVG